MELLTDRGLHRAFLGVVEETRREGLPVVIDRDGTAAEAIPDDLGVESASTRNRIAELAKYREQPFSINETPGE
jgi:hypothetical protein